jgi:hypothetical protein
MDKTEAARQQAQAEHQHGIGKANTSNWGYDAQKAYEAERERLKTLNEKKTT